MNSDDINQLGREKFQAIAESYVRCQLQQRDI